MTDWQPLSPILRKDGINDDLLYFMCPGCGTEHVIRYGGHDTWSWNGNVLKPTFLPSVKVTYNGPDADTGGRPAAICHSFVTDGRIQFLADSTHALAGQTVDLPEFPA